jgi:hypothetical protein
MLFFDGVADTKYSGWPVWFVTMEASVPDVPMSTMPKATLVTEKWMLWFDAPAGDDTSAVAATNSAPTRAAMLVRVDPLEERLS